MEDERIIRNFWGKEVARIRKRSDGKYYITDFFGKTLGYYDPKARNGQGATYDFFGKMIAEGDVLSSLIKKWD